MDRFPSFLFGGVCGGPLAAGLLAARFPEKHVKVSKKVFQFILLMGYKMKKGFASFLFMSFLLAYVPYSTGLIQDDDTPNRVAQGDLKCSSFIGGKERI